MIVTALDDTLTPPTRRPHLDDDDKDGDGGGAVCRGLQTHRGPTTRSPRARAASRQAPERRSAPSSSSSRTRHHNRGEPTREAGEARVPRPLSRHTATTRSSLDREGMKERHDVCFRANATHPPLPHARPRRRVRRPRLLARRRLRREDDSGSLDSVFEPEGHAPPNDTTTRPPTSSSPPS
mmetsp:Transcript_14770/g.59122  ORF Transcript_14770/g.59122 Transcript_14770/m.59122 type:complete len:181 (+) Transcript_14770:308-850(+)